MSVVTGLVILSLLVSSFALVAVCGVYIRLKQTEHAVFAALFAESEVTVPELLRPGPEVAATLVLALDGSCPACGRLEAAVTAGVRSGALSRYRVVRVLAGPAGDDESVPPEGMETFDDPDTWTAVYEGYAPTVSVVDTGGRIVHRRFVYLDTDMDALVEELRGRFAAPALAPPTTS